MAWVITRQGPRGIRYTGTYRDPDGRTRSAGSFSTRRDALRAANREEQKVLGGAWHDNTQGDITFRDYVEKEWLPNKQVEASTRAAYISYLDKHFYPLFGQRRLNKISPALVQDWVTQAKADGLAPRSIRKYHVFLSSVFGRAVKDRVLVYNPCDHTELPKVVTAKARTLTPGEYERLQSALPAQHRLMIETLIEAGLRWGELVALKPRHIDFLRRTLDVEETIVEVSKKHSPTGERYLAKPYPKDNEPRTFGVRQAWLDTIAEHIRSKGIGRDELLFATSAGTPISRNTFRTRVWLPAVRASGVDFPVRVHDLRHAHASWLLAGGADLKSVMERMGHSQIQTTQRYLHTLPDTDQRSLDALTRIQSRDT
ncbi:integrase [Nocardioides sp. Root190]|uniref:tyrosine-type recombinase/integrase n=1 Tax=Nocardioides sp. Root190 TaxID=1736488 RepID=UPI0006FB8E09|nr:tyrosine-type recombinase/integrase [Nocardioides sp. Root190]KRB75112.1 integrase [Nocardioides sp. Root190]